MAEIKSTLDIIMEKAKALTVTEEEKAAFRKEGVRQRVAGLFQRYVDGALDLERLKEAMASFSEDERDIARQGLRDAVLEALDPDADNQALFQVLASILDVDPGPLREAVAEFEETLERERASREKQARTRLEEAGLSGSAVVPNLRADPEWDRTVSGARARFRERTAAFRREWMDPQVREG